MPDIRMRPKHQVTLPASIVRQAGIKPDDKLSVRYLNGSIVITPKQTERASHDIMRFAGIGRGLWGKSPEEVNQTLCEMKNAWEK